MDGKRKINFGELKITDLAKKHIQDCLDTNQVSCGPKVALFEEKWAKLFNYKHTTMLSSGTSAVTAACMALYDYDAQPGDYIICPGLSFIATANAIRAAGFTPWFIDIEKSTLNISDNGLERVLAGQFFKEDLKQPRAILAVNLMGKPSRLDIISQLAQHYNLKLIVDNCEGYGSQCRGKYALEYADMECTSHYIAHIICSAEGGTVSTNETNINNIIRSIRSHGRKPDDLYFEHERFGLNFKPTDLNASIGLGEIDEFWEIFNQRRANIQYFRNSVKDFEDKAYFIEEDEKDMNAPHGFSITLKENYASNQNIQYIQHTLDEATIQWKRNFGSMGHHKAFKYLEYHSIYCINCQYVGRYGIHIGCHYWMSDEDVAYVGDVLRQALEGVK